jgi:hypothetical protein
MCIIIMCNNIELINKICLYQIEGQAIQWSNNTMVKQYNGQTIQWSNNTMVKRKSTKTQKQLSTKHYIGLTVHISKRI